MRLLVTGGAGYIGSVVASQLLEEKHDVIVLDNLSKGHRSAVPDDASFVRGNLLDRERLARLLATGFDGVLHFAALSLVGESVEHPGRYYQSNVVGTLNLLEGMRIAGVPRLVFSSTATVYGEPEEVSITEVTPTRLTNPYGGSKLAVDGMIGFHVAAHGLQATSLRYFNGASFSVREVVRTAREVTGREIKAVEAPRRAGDPAVLVTSSQKIRDELGWTPKKPELDAIVSDAWDWMKAYPRGYGDVTNSRYTLRDPNGFASSMHIPPFGCDAA